LTEHEHPLFPSVEVLAPEPPAEPISRPGEVYALGPHRLVCGDSTDPAIVALALAGERPAIMVTDPPYGVEVDLLWRDERSKFRPGMKETANASPFHVANDDRVDWSEAYRLGGARVAYVWHAHFYGGEVKASLVAAGFDPRQPLVWRKRVHALSRSHYHWQHEACWYAVAKGESANWKGGRDQMSVWDAGSPRAFGAGDTYITKHPTQKPCDLWERAYMNHTDEGDLVYDPFGGSGVALVAAARTKRRAVLVELEPMWCDVIRERWAHYTGER